MFFILTLVFESSPCQVGYQLIKFVTKHSRYNFMYDLFQEVRASKMRKNNIYIQVYVVWMKIFFIEIIPYILVIVLNSIMFAR